MRKEERKLEEEGLIGGYTLRRQRNRFKVSIARNCDNNNCCHNAARVAETAGGGNALLFGPGTANPHHQIFVK